MEAAAAMYNQVDYFARVTRTGRLTRTFLLASVKANVQSGDIGIGHGRFI